MLLSTIRSHYHYHRRGIPTQQTMTSNSIYTCLICLFYGMQSTDLCNAFEAITYIANGLLHMFNVHHFDGHGIRKPLRCPPPSDVS
eukprot:scaffold48876_cov40-Cyclotella_meneghiniana.AAC.2